MTTADAAVAADRDQQCRGAPPERLVRQTTRERIPRDALTPAAAAPLVWLADPAGQDRAIGLEELPDGFQAELLQTAEQSDQDR